ncbi:MAG TPA: lytic murein transglycosylase [Ideonella sp.]|uniref:lytic murein transglycosylase n=1 Tax=Ideonella sp. TaxID=1929293 RepID=UPI002CFCFE63|nr:lytic murein transglycosylase [Ideonella sp.]HSI46950.1 lytic murein transglycosylase [Ideonella sp.]
MPSTVLPPRHWRLAATLAAATFNGCAAGPAATAASAPAPAVSAAAAVPAASAASSPEELARQQVAQQAAFARWVQDMRGRARSTGISEATLRMAFDEVQLLPQVIEQDQAQPELTRTVWDYLDRAVSATRISQGQEKLQQIRAEAEAAAARHGVPSNVIVAIWGMESNYGSHYGDIPTIDALATLGFEGRREDWARGQLIAALKILQSGDIARANMIGSWAGAMGQTQFLPTAFLSYAEDADGDGKRDIWGSMADVTASTANFLARSGWMASEPWGAEVLLPKDFDPGRADSELRQPSSKWAGEGVKGLDGRPLPPMAEASILLPAGIRGPAFLVGANFRSILRYNNSNSYALAVGLLAQRLAGGPGVQGSWPRDLRALTRTELLAMQAALNQRGFNTGTPDGRFGPATRAALRGYQRSIGVPPDGFPDQNLLGRLTAQ